MLFSENTNVCFGVVIKLLKNKNILRRTSQKMCFELLMGNKVKQHINAFFKHISCCLITYNVTSLKCFTRFNFSFQNYQYVKSKVLIHTAKKVLHSFRRVDILK